MVQAATIRRRVRSDLVRLTRRDQGFDTFASAAAGLIGRAVPGDGVCLVTLDPATLLPTGEFVENGLPADVMPRMAEIEVGEADVNKFVDLARRPVPAASLSEATRGELDRSRRHRELRRPSGFGDELRVSLGDGSQTWAALTLLRANGRPDYTAAEIRFVASLARILADGVRRAFLAAPSTEDTEDSAAPVLRGLVVLAPDGSVEMTDRGGDHWLGALTATGVTGIPAVVAAVADRARRADDDDLATARVRTAAGRWLVVRGSVLGTGPDAKVAVRFEPAEAPQLAPLLVAAYGFTPQERRVTELVARGYSTKEVAAALQMAAYTVQDHLKSIFEKSGTSSRGELVSRLFVDGQAPPL